MKKRYVCTACGTEFISWFGQCSQCGEWGTAEEVLVDKKSKNKIEKIQENKAMPLKEIPLDDNQRMHSTMEEINRVLGGGLVKDSVSILTAPPGVGKSTLLLELSRIWQSKAIACSMLPAGKVKGRLRHPAYYGENTEIRLDSVYYLDG